MLRIILTVLAVFLVFSCASGSQRHSIQIIDSHGQSFQLSNISEQLKNDYALEKNPAVLVLLTDELDSRKYVEQLSILNSVSAEDYQYVYVVGCTTDREKSGYSISIETASDMLSSKNFQIRIYDGYGKLAYSSENVLGEQELKMHLSKNSSGR